MSPRQVWLGVGVLGVSLTLGFLLGPILSREPRLEVSSGAEMASPVDRRLQVVVAQSHGDPRVVDSAVRALGGQVLLVSDSLMEALIPDENGRWRVIRFSPRDSASLTGLTLPAWAEPVMLSHPVR